MKILRRLFLQVLLLCGLTRTALAGDDTFWIGVAPHTSARVIIAMYQPLRHYLEKALGRHVAIVTAPNFTDTAWRALHQQYDLVITTGHQSRLLQTDAGYIPLLTYKADFYAVALVAKTSPITEPAQLSKGKALGLSKTSLVTLWGLHWLQQNNLSDMEVQYVSASDSVARLITAKSADVGFVSFANYQQLDPAIQAELRIFSQSSPLAGRVYMLNHRYLRVKDKIERALWHFAQTPEGMHYFDTYQLGGYRKLRPNELAEMDSFANEVRKELKAYKQHL